LVKLIRSLPTDMGMGVCNAYNARLHTQLTEMVTNWQGVGVGVGGKVLAQTATSTHPLLIPLPIALY
jgi:hypothetical protein